MKISQLLTLLQESRLSPEQLAKRTGLSHMTIRRWMKRPPEQALPEVYDKVFEETTFQLIVDGKLNAESKTAQRVMQSGESLSFQAALKSLGFSKDLGKAKGSALDKLMLGLSQVGASATRQAQVDKNKKKIFSFEQIGQEWKERIDTLWQVVRSVELNAMDKLVAYGALFYLIWPFDLIPDSIPVFGLVDDYAILGLATAYYLKRFSHLKKKQNF